MILENPLRGSTRAGEGAMTLLPSPQPPMFPQKSAKAKLACHSLSQPFTSTAPPAPCTNPELRIRSSWKGRGHYSFPSWVPQSFCLFCHAAPAFSDSDFCNGSLVSAVLQLFSDNFKQPSITASAAAVAGCRLPASLRTRALILLCYAGWVLKAE